MSLKYLCTPANRFFRKMVRCVPSYAIEVDPNSLRAKMDEVARAKADSSGGAMKDSSRTTMETVKKVKQLPPKSCCLQNAATSS